MSVGRYLASASLVLIALGPSMTAAGVMKQPTLQQALQARPEDLARAYLATLNYLWGVDVASHGGVAQVGLDGTQVQIDSTNVDEMRKGFQARLETYRTAIVQRGFPQLAGDYAFRKGAECLYASNQHGRLTQDGFELRLAVTPPDAHELIHHGIVVESSLVFENSMDPDELFIGKVANGKLQLKSSGGCKLELVHP